MEYLSQDIELPSAWKCWIEPRNLLVWEISRRSLGGQNYYLAEGSAKPQIEKKWLVRVMQNIWSFLYLYFHNNVSQIGLLLCIHITVLHLKYFVLIWFLKKFHQLIIFFSWADFIVLLILFILLLTLNLIW